MKIKLIVAVSKNGIIGVNDDIPWYIPEDLKFFKNHTINKHVIMGRKTYEKLPEKAKLNRQYLVVGTTPVSGAIQFFDIKSLMHFLLLNRQKINEVYIAGGTQIYKNFLELCDKIILTLVDINIDDTSKENKEYHYFPLNKLRENFFIKRKTGWKKSKAGVLYQHQYFIPQSKVINLV
ncbi:MAG: dihydrofolate reductase [bacterium]